MLDDVTHALKGRARHQPVRVLLIINETCDTTHRLTHHVLSRTRQRLLRFFAYGLPAGIALAAKKLMKGNQRSEICQNEILRQGEQTTAHSGAFENPGQHRAPTRTALRD